MEHNLEFKIEKKPFTNQEGKTIEYINCYLVFDNYMVIKLDKSDNLKNLTKYLKSGGTLNIIGNSFKLSK